MTRLGINIDHIATIRNARGSTHPDPLLAAKKVINSGANSVTIHLREDRRHIKDSDVFKICKEKKILVNLEISLNSKILKIALRNQPNFICLVPENRKEITTEGGLNLSKNKNKIKKIISQFKKKNIRTSLFINPTIKDIKLAKKLDTDCIELHTGKISNLVKANKNFYRELVMIKKCCKLASLIGLEVHAGHGLDYKTTKILKKIKQIEEFNIGHFIIGESIFYGLDKTIKTFKKIIK
ncbi:pyridoxine 5'-phosphate synthase [Candidatus Pelagibacter bacterium]|jgi:pyridoxine 5-phosphate synthase|nr:pyridoxine 5'-phosphate synthase [Candidatus Pelagibacter sp.]MDB2341266.1 pyridoxine 5'-phosphate synthase [Candidatus Pelagibacter bacterium]